jgi:RHS repeat-associated protein
MGMRVAKEIYDSNNNWEKTTYYVRDPQGNVMGIYEKQVDAQSQQLSLKIIERDIYGSSRVGMNVTEVELIGASGSGTVFTHTIGKKQYEVSNHLGNVLSVVTDQVLANDWNADNVVDYFRAEIVNASDYTPFGVQMDGRRFVVDEYRYGFNNKEGDSEIGTVDYGFRMFNQLLARFLSTDPLVKEYPHYSAYQFAGNKPIVAIDIEGKEEFVITDYYNAAGVLYKTEVTVVNQYNADENGVSQGQMVHRSENRPVVNVTGQTVGYTTQYVGTTISAPGVTAFKDINEENLILGVTAMTGAPGTVVAQYQVTAGANPQFTSTFGVVSPAGVPVIAAGAPAIPTGNTLVLTNPAAATPVPVGPPGAVAPPGNLPYEPTGMNAVPADPSQRTDQAGNPIPCTGGGNCGGTPGVEIGAIGSIGTAGNPAGVTQPIPNVPSVTAVGNNAPGASAGTGAFNVNINSNWAAPTPGPSLAAPGGNIAPSRNQRSTQQLNNYGNNRY